MSSLSLIATYTGIAVPEDRWWVRLEQILIADDVATISTAATFLDAAFAIDPCEDSSEPAEEPEVADVAEAAAKTIDFVICNQDDAGTIEVQIKVIRSHQSEPYRLHVAGGKIVETLVVQEELSRSDTVESAESLELDYPVIGAFAASWQKDIVTASGYSPSIRRNGNTLYWQDAATGTIQSTYLTTYDLVTIRIIGVDGEPGEATVRVVFHALAEDLVPELPAPADSDRSRCWTSRWQANTDSEVTCYKEITKITRCSCSQEEVIREIIPQVVPCPEGHNIQCPGVLKTCMHLLGSETVSEYVECPGDNEIPGRPGMVYSVSRAKYYEEICCKSPPGNLPDCLEKITSYKGGQPIDKGEAFYRALYGETTSFVPVSPRGGVCGQHITRQVVLSENCCDGVEPLAWDRSISPEVMSPNSSVIVGITGGGRYPYEWTVSGSGFQFSNGATKITTTGSSVRLAALPLACGTAHITVTDGCSIVTGRVRSTSGEWTDGCRLVHIGQRTPYFSNTFYRTPIALAEDGCSIIPAGTEFWYKSPVNVYYVEIKHWYFFWNGSKWYPDGVWGGTVLKSELDDLISLVRIKVVSVRPGDEAPTGDPAEFSCGASVCDWRCSDG